MGEDIWHGIKSEIWRSPCRNIEPLVHIKELDTFRNLAGKILCSYFDKLEAKAWEKTKYKPHINILSWDMGEEWYSMVIRNADYYAFLKTHYGKPSPYAGYYMNSYLIKRLILSKIYRFFGITPVEKLYDPFNPIKSILGYFLKQYFTSLKLRSSMEKDKYYLLSWGMGEQWFHEWEKQAYLEAEINTQCKERPRYYRYYTEKAMLYYLILSKINRELL